MRSKHLSKPELGATPVPALRVVPETDQKTGFIDLF